MYKRAEERYHEKILAARSRPDRRESSESFSSECGTFTRSQSVPYKREICFFCDVGATKGDPLHIVATENAGRALEKAVELSNNERLCVKLDGKVIGVFQTTYTSILSANDVRDPTCSRPKLKKLRLREITDEEFHKAKHANEPERVSSKRTKDAAMQLAENSTDADINALYDAASVLRRAISKAQPWSFSRSLLDVDEEHLLKELYSSFRWMIQGPNTTLSSDAKSSAVTRNAISLAQTKVSMFLCKHQVRRKTLNTAREVPQQLAVGVAIRQAIRNKKVINIFYGFGMYVAHGVPDCYQCGEENDVQW